MRGALSVAVVTLAAAVPTATAQEPATDLVVRAQALLEKAPFIDTHNDHPTVLLEQRGGDLAGLDLGAVQPGLCADVPRLCEGRVGAQYWSVYVPSSTMRTRTALHEALREFDVALRAIAGRPELELARTADDIVRIHGEGKIASLIGVGAAT